MSYWWINCSSQETPGSESRTGKRAEPPNPACHCLRGANINLIVTTSMSRSSVWCLMRGGLQKVIASSQCSDTPTDRDHGTFSSIRYRIYYFVLTKSRRQNSTVAFLLQTQSCERWVPVGRRFKKRLEIPLSGACVTERGEIMHVPDSVKSSPLSHGYPALMSEGKWWKGKGWVGKTEA